MSGGYYDAAELGAMAAAANDPNVHPSKKAENALRVLPQLTSTDMHACIAFGLDPFSYLAARLSMADALAQERVERQRSAEFFAREARQRAAWMPEADTLASQAPEPGIREAEALAVEARQVAQERGIPFSSAMSIVAGRVTE